MAKSKQTPVSKVLRRALKRVRRGWCQRISRDGRCYCLNAAVGHGSLSHDLARRELKATIRDGGRCELLVPFNDHHLRTKEHVIHVIAHTIARVEREAAR